MLFWIISWKVSKNWLAFPGPSEVFHSRTSYQEIPSFFCAICSKFKRFLERGMRVPVTWHNNPAGSNNKGANSCRSRLAHDPYGQARAKHVNHLYKNRHELNKIKIQVGFLYFLMRKVPAAIFRLLSRTFLATVNSQTTTMILMSIMFIGAVTALNQKLGGRLLRSCSCASNQDIIVKEEPIEQPFQWRCEPTQMPIAHRAAPF